MWALLVANAPRQRTCGGIQAFCVLRLTVVCGYGGAATRRALLRALYFGECSVVWAGGRRVPVKRGRVSWHLISADSKCEEQAGKNRGRSFPSFGGYVRAFEAAACEVCTPSCSSAASAQRLVCGSPAARRRSRLAAFAHVLRPSVMTTPSVMSWPPNFARRLARCVTRDLP